MRASSCRAGLGEVILTILHHASQREVGEGGEHTLVRSAVQFCIFVFFATGCPMHTKEPYNLFQRFVRNTLMLFILAFIYRIRFHGRD